MKKRIFLVFILLFLVGIITTVLLSFSFNKVFYLDILEDRLTSNSLLIKDLLLSDKNLNEKDLDTLAKTYSEKIHARVVFYDNQNNIIGSSLKKSIEKDLVNNGLIHINVPIKKQSLQISNIKIYVTSKDIEIVSKKYLQYVVISVFCGIIVVFLLSIRYIQHIASPYEQLIHITKRISDGNYGEKVNFNGSKELNILSHNFNNMSIKLCDTVTKLQKSNTKLKATLTSIVDGLIVVDNNFIVTLFNPIAEKIFNVKQQEVIGKDVRQIFKNKFLGTIIEHLASKSVLSFEKEFEILYPDYKVLNIFSNPITLVKDPTRKLGTVFIIQDITKLKKLERVRKDFVANVSHELKTPLTSIKGFIETLKDGAINDKQASKRFLSIIDEEVNRLNSLIQDLLLLSEVESNKRKILKQYFDPKEAIDEVIQIVNKIAKGKEIKIEKEIQKDVPNIYGNYNYFKQMIINLVDNAIKYTPRGGEVVVIMYEFNSNLTVKIRDTGIGIDKEHQIRLFERFYRVDKARSRQVGGTGLGLAIVKHIVMIFKGSVKVESNVGKGSTFIITIPIKN